LDEAVAQLEWITSDGSTQSFQSSSAIPTNQNLTTELLVTPSQQQLTQLLELVMQGDIRGALSEINQWQQAEPHLAPFAQQIRQLAETCQLKKLKHLIRQYIETV
jgi:two-component system CheB/CheR fusion protein